VKISLVGALLILASLGYGQEKSETQFSGTAVNTTNADKPIAVPIQIIVRQGVCTLSVSPPLTGSGSCEIKSYDKRTGNIEIVSTGPPVIVWTGSIRGNFASGTYKVDVDAQTGSFYLAILRQPQRAATPPSPSAATPPVARRSSCVPAIESSIDGEIEGWEGETIFKLANGQIWQQAEYNYTYFYAYSPDVTIYQTSAGCRMKVEDEDETVVVKRLK
jgi:hypothetical protein